MTGHFADIEIGADDAEPSTKIELIVNLKTAKALGLTLPLSLVGPANQVTE
jgi:putative ABC transport system substrate-binding protein